MNALIKSLVSTQAGYGLTVLRIVAGLTFAAHGAQKLFGWFGGYGLEGVGQWMESIGLAPGYLMAVLAVTMLVAIFTVHLANGFFMSNNGYEFALALLAISLAVMLEGAGKLSLDKRIARSEEH